MVLVFQCGRRHGEPHSIQMFRRAKANKVKNAHNKKQGKRNGFVKASSLDCASS